MTTCACFSDPAGSTATVAERPSPHSNSRGGDVGPRRYPAPRRRAENPADCGAPTADDRAESAAKKGARHGLALVLREPASPEPILTQRLFPNFEAFLILHYGLAFRPQTVRRRTGGLPRRRVLGLRLVSTKTANGHGEIRLIRGCACWSPLCPGRPRVSSTEYPGPRQAVRRRGAAPEAEPV